VILIRTRDLVKKLRNRFGEVSIIEMWVSRVIEREGKNTVVLEGVIEAITEKGELLCGGSIVRAECDFLNAIYATPLSSLVYKALLREPLIYTHFRQSNVKFFSYVPCKFENVNINTFRMVSNDGSLSCPYEKTDKCPLRKVMMLSS